MSKFGPGMWSILRPDGDSSTTFTVTHHVWPEAINGPHHYGRADFEDITVLEALKFRARHQDGDLSFDSLNRRVSILHHYGTVHEVLFTSGRQLTDIKKSERNPKTTVIYPVGAEDMTIASVNDGVEYVEDYGYYMAQGLTLEQARERYRKEDYWCDERYTVAENLFRDAQKRLEEEAYPAITYTLTAAATTAVEGSDDFDLGELYLGDKVCVWDDEIDARLQATVTAAPPARMPRRMS